MVEPLAWKADQRRIRALVFSPDGSQLATGGDSRAVKIWDATSGIAVATMPPIPGKIMSLVYVDAGTLAAGATDNVIHIFDPRSSRQISRCVGHEGSVTCLAASSTQGQLFSGSFDTTVRVWELGTRPEEDVVLQPGTNPVIQ
jgi:WD40 repeat protein